MLKINPWLSNRKKTLLINFTEIFIIFLFFNALKLIFDLSIETFLLLKLITSFSIFWIVSSYLIGRNYINLLTKRDYLKHMLGTLLVTIICFQSNYFINSWTNIDSFNFNYLSSAYSFILFFIAISFSNYVLLDFFRKENLNKKKIILLIDPLKENQLLPFGLKNYNYFIQDENLIKVKNLRIKETIFVVENFLSLKNPTKRLLNKILLKGGRVESLFKWVEKNLESCPNAIISESNIIEGDFLIERNSFEYRLKRLGDISFSIFLILISSPIVLLAAIFIKLEDGGEIFYSQKRIGLNGKLFWIKKLRSMSENAEQGKAIWSSNNDPRITKVGKFIRKTRIDELPQLWCVVNGSMSLIGPRPERPEFDKTLLKKIKHYKLRQTIRPGLSGWAQVKYKYSNSLKNSETKLGYDLYYLRNFSFGLDILILLKTIRLILSSFFKSKENLFVNKT